MVFSLEEKSDVAALIPRLETMRRDAFVALSPRGETDWGSLHDDRLTSPSLCILIRRLPAMRWPNDASEPLWQGGRLAPKKSDISHTTPRILTISVDAESAQSGIARIGDLPRGAGVRALL
jgi:hypothetical protein